MILDNFLEVRELFDRIVGLPVAERDAALRAATADENLIREVLTLCAVGDLQTTRFGNPLGAMIESVSASILAPGDTLGAWRVVREIGSGGMGSVYLVERTDGHYRQTAALKFVRGAPRPDTLAYFTRERQLLATLAHPHVARLLDGGASPRGQPYLVMEFIDGVPIDRYCSERKLDTRAILALFVTACGAVAFSHRQLVVHCDLKPSNLLVDRNGRPVLLDFGIAKLLDQVGQAPVEAGPVETGDLVAAAQRNVHATAGFARTAPFTPRYASPEQRERGAVSTASDIYSLGVMLGELLDRLPGKDGSRIDPDAPLRERELSAMLAKATETDPARRYASVDALTDDIHRYLRQEPVAAMPGAALYPARKWFVRRWPVALAVAAFAATVVGFTAKVVVESQRAQGAERQALADRDRAQSAEQRAVAERDATRLARTEALSERDAARTARMESERERDRATVAERARARERDRAVAAESSALAERNRATQAESATRQTNEFLISVFESGNPDAKSGDLPMSQVLTRAEARVEQKLAGQPAMQAELYGMLSRVRDNMGSNDAARKNLVRAIELERTQSRPLVLSRLLREYSALDLAAFGGKETEAYAREAMALAERHAAPDSADMSEALRTLASALASKGQMKEALALALRALDIEEKKDAAGEMTAAASSLLGALASSERRFADAVGYHRRAIGIYTALEGADSLRVLSQESLLATALENDRKLAEAEVLMRKVLATNERLHGRDNSNTMRQYMRLASLLQAQSKPKEGLEQLGIASSIAEKTAGRDSTSYIVVQNNIAGALREMGRVDEAIVILREMLPHARQLWPGDSLGRLQLERNVGLTMSNRGLVDEARPLLTSAYETSRRLNGEAHRDTTRLMLDLASLETRSGKPDDAAVWLAKADRQMPANDGRMTIQRHAVGGELAMLNQDYGLAFGEFAKAEEANRQLYGDKDARYWLARMNRITVLTARNQGNDMADARTLAAEIHEKLAPTLDPTAGAIVKLKRLMQQ